MRTTLDFLDAVKARHALPSDYKLAQFMGISKQVISGYRNGKSLMDDQTALKVAELLDLSPGIVLSAVHAERAKSESEKAAWNSIFEKLGGLAASVLLVSCLLPSPADASVSGPSASQQSDSVLCQT